MIRIALADDHPRVRDIWNFILSANASFEVVAKCCNGQEAVDAASAFAPDIFLMDINMQPVNGIEATEIIKKLYPAIRVICMSIHFDTAYVKRALRAGARGYVTKIASYEEVFEAIEQVHTGQYYICNEVQNRLPGLQLV